METSNRARWKVRKNIFGRIAPGPLPGWEVIEPNCTYKFRFAPNYFSTWEEALAYADRKARTVEVVLPRVAEPPKYGYVVDPNDPWVYSWRGRWHVAPIGDWDGVAALLCNELGEYKIGADELRPLALALLALAEREGDT